MTKLNLVRTVSFVSAFAFTVFGLINLTKNKSTSSEVLSSKTVNITATVNACSLSMEVIPENRVPATNNWSESVNVQIFDTNDVYKGEFNTTISNTGNSTVDLCANNITLTSGTYNFYIKGSSHLREKFSGFTGFNTAGTYFDFSSSKSNLLLAGEVSVIYDNYINVLDLSVEANQLTQNANKFDLNKDSQVNILDVANIIKNFYTYGDCSPIEKNNNICD